MKSALFFGSARLLIKVPSLTTAEETEMRNILLASALSFSTLLAHASDGERSKWSLNINCCSWHENSKMRAWANQVNPGLGLRYDLNKNFYLEANYIDKNSTKGETLTAALGGHIEIGTIAGKPLLGGIQVDYMSYHFLPRNKTYHGFLPLATFEYEIIRDVMPYVAVLPAPNKMIFVFGLNVRF